MATEKRLPKCLVKKCGNQSKKRGLCPRCYQAALREVKEGRRSWTELQKLGLVAPGKKKPGGPPSPFIQELAALSK